MSIYNRRRLRIGDGVTCDEGGNGSSPGRGVNRKRDRRGGVRGVYLAAVVIPFTTPERRKPMPTVAVAEVDEVCRGGGGGGGGPHSRGRRTGRIDTEAGPYR